MTELRVLQVASSNETFFEQQVAGLEDQGIECRTVAIGSNRSNGRGRGIQAYASLYRQLLAERTESYDLVHAHYGLIGPLALAQPHRPVVLTIWGSEVMNFTRRLDKITRWSARWSDAVIAPSRTVSDRLDCEHSIVPFGVDLDRFRPISRKESRQHLGWDQAERIVLFPYDPSRRVKRYDLAEATVSALSIPATLKVVTGRPYEEMPFVYNASDVVLVTSDRESGPMVVREAAACNIPIVSRNVGFVSETLDSVKNSVIVDHPEELSPALASVLRSSGRSNARENVYEFGIDRTANKLLAVYQSVVGNDTESIGA